MTEEVTDRMAAILRHLAAADDLSDFQPVHLIAQGAFGSQTRLGVARNELGILSWRGLVEQSTLNADRYRITELGAEAAG